MLISVIVIIQPLPLGNVPSSDQKDLAFTIYIVSHALKILLLPPVPAKVSTMVVDILDSQNILTEPNKEVCNVASLDDKICS